MGDHLTVKYIPGSRHNIVILAYESAYLLQIWQGRLRWQKDHYESFPDALNLLSYKLALTELLGKFRNTAHPDIVFRYEADLFHLNTGSERPVTRIDEAG